MNAPFNLVPQFIDERFAVGQHEGSLDAVTLFMDMSGFTAMTQAFMQRGRDGAETLSTILNKIFPPIVQAVYEQKGFITGFAGDAFYPPPHRTRKTAGHPLWRVHPGRADGPLGGEGGGAWRGQRANEPTFRGRGIERYSPG
ncbi:MAG: hypothetical protein IPL78_09710 [Chloroflexi bacterium]|nr:hypothetical protein [Chloroflexota bacterium]